MPVPLLLEPMVCISYVHVMLLHNLSVQHVLYPLCMMCGVGVHEHASMPASEISSLQVAKIAELYVLTIRSLSRRAAVQVHLSLCRHACIYVRIHGMHSVAIEIA